MIIDSIEIPEPALRAIAALIAKYYRAEIGEAMRQAKHWASEEHHYPLAVHCRVNAADSYFQIVALCERFERWNENPFETMLKSLNRGPFFAPGGYPPSPEIHRYRDARFVVEALKTVSPEAGGPRP